MKTAICCALCLYAALSLTACSTAPAPRIEIVEVPVTHYASLPRELTEPLPVPVSPPRECRLDGAPAVCALDALIWIAAWQKTLERANEDRATAARLGLRDTDRVNQP